jgi:hypothetical protein
VEDTHLGDSGAIEAVLVNTNQFYKWFTDLESAMKSETEEKYRHYVSTLTERIQTCDNILHQVDETLDLFNELQLQHQGVTTKTKTLHDACDRLVPFPLVFYAARLFIVSLNLLHVFPSYLLYIIKMTNKSCLMHHGCSRVPDSHYLTVVVCLAELIFTFFHFF